MLVLFAALLVGSVAWFVWGRLALVSGPLRRLQPFSTWEVVRAAAHGDREVDVVVRLSQPIPEMTPSIIAAHRAYGHINGNVFVHAHRFVLHEGRAWRIYQFEEADARP